MDRKPEDQRRSLALIKHQLQIEVILFHIRFAFSFITVERIHPKILKPYSGMYGLSRSDHFRSRGIYRFEKMVYRHR